MAAFSATQANSDPSTWWQHATVVAVVAVVLNGIFYFVQFSTDDHLPLIRDVIATAWLAAGITFVVAAVGRWVSIRRFSLGTQSIVCFVVAITLSLPSPLVQLLVHCTSGDCL